MPRQMSQRRAKLLGNVRRVVVQVGSSLLVETPVARMRGLATLVAGLRQGGIEVMLVTSGAIRLGAARLGLKQVPQQIPLLKAVSAVGQVELVRTLEDALSAHGIFVGQVMVTDGDLDDRTRFLHLRHTLMALLDYGVVPLAGENQAISEHALLQDQNDMVAARLTRLVEADLLVLLTSAEGLYGSSPRRGGQVVHLVEDIDTLVAKLGQAVARHRTLTGAYSKVLAAQRAATFGVPTVVASGLRPGVLRDLLDDDSVGTLLLPARIRRSRKQWIADDLVPAGRVSVDAAGRHAVLDEGYSLQAVHLLEVEGDFKPGDSVRVLDEDGTELARGLCGYSATELRRILGLSPADIEKLLGRRTYTEVIRRDDLVVI